MKIKCDVELCYNSKEQAKKIFESVHVDDASFMDSKINKNMILTTINTSSISSMIHTIDDYLACVKVAENIIEKKK